MKFDFIPAYHSIHAKSFILDFKKNIESNIESFLSLVKISNKNIEENYQKSLKDLNEEKEMLENAFIKRKKELIINGLDAEEADSEAKEESGYYDFDLQYEWKFKSFKQFKLFSIDKENKNFLLMVYSFFETSYANLVKSIQLYKKEIVTSNNSYINTSKKYIDTLRIKDNSILYDKIDGFREIRNSIAHNNSKIISERGKQKKTIKEEINLSFIKDNVNLFSTDLWEGDFIKENVLISYSEINKHNKDNVYFEFKNEKPLLNFISLIKEYYFDLIWSIEKHFNFLTIEDYFIQAFDSGQIKLDKSEKIKINADATQIELVLSIYASSLIVMKIVLKTAMQNQAKFHIINDIIEIKEGQKKEIDNLLSKYEQLIRNIIFECCNPLQKKTTSITLLLKDKV